MKQDNELRNNLKLIRTRLGLSQQELANLAGVARQTISFVELGQCAPSVMITLCNQSEHHFMSLIIMR